MPEGPDPDTCGREFRLLAACSWRPGPPLDRVQAARIGEELAQGIHWPAFLALVDRHRLASLVHSNLPKAGAGPVPEAIRAALLDRVRGDTARALRHSAELGTLSRSLETMGIQVLPLKGPTLSLRLYQDPARRSLKDVDLLVHPQDLLRADAWILAQGYRRLEPQMGAGPRLLAVYMARSHHFAYRHPARGILLELHWRFHAWSTGQVERLWDHAAEQPVLGGVRQLDDDALLILLCEHGSRHAWFRLKWLSDVAMLLSQKGGDSWEVTLHLAQAFDARPALAQAVLLCHRLYAVEVPEPVRALLLELPASEWLVRQALRALNAPGERVHANVMVRLWMGYRYQHALDPGCSLFRYLGQIGVNLDDFQAWPLPDRWSFLYFGLRPFLWLHRRWFRRT